METLDVYFSIGPGYGKPAINWQNLMPCAGSLKIGRGEFLFEFELLGPGEIDKRGLDASQVGDARQILKLTLTRRDKSQISLKDDEFRFFFPVMTEIFKSWIVQEDTKNYLNAIIDPHLEEVFDPNNHRPILQGMLGIVQPLKKGIKILSRPKFNCGL